MDWGDSCWVGAGCVGLVADPPMAKGEPWVGHPAPAGDGAKKGEMRGSLHCATDGGAVRRFGRDDVLFFFYESFMG
jgi:hypothetical protein